MSGIITLEERDIMNIAPETCLYCDGDGNSSAGGSCGFCVQGKPSDTQEDWDKSWGKLLHDLGFPKKCPCGVLNCQENDHLFWPKGDR